MMRQCNSKCCGMMVNYDEALGNCGRSMRHCNGTVDHEVGQWKIVIGQWDTGVGEVDECDRMEECCDKKVVHRNDNWEFEMEEGDNCGGMIGSYDKKNEALCWQMKNCYRMKDYCGGKDEHRVGTSDQHDETVVHSDGTVESCE